MELELEMSENTKHILNNFKFVISSQGKQIIKSKIENTIQEAGDIKEWKEFWTLVINCGGNSSTSDENQSNSETKTLSTRNNLEQLQNVLGRDQIWLGLTTNDLDSIPLTS